MKKKSLSLSQSYQWRPPKEKIGKFQTACYPWQPVAKKPKPILNWNSFGYWNNFQIVIIQVVLSNEVIRQLFQFARKGITCIHTVKIICTHQFVCQYIFTESSIWQELKQNNRLFFSIIFSFTNIQREPMEGMELFYTPH